MFEVEVNMSSLIPIPMNRIHRLEYLVSQLTSKLVTIQSIAAGSGSGNSQPVDTTHISRLSVNTVDDLNTVKTFRMLMTQSKH